MIIIDDIQQGTDKWDALRVGNPGASSMNNIITAKGNRSSNFDKYLVTMYDESVTQRKVEGYSNYLMQQKLLREADSRADYQMMYNIEVVQVALCYKDENRYFHCSPDGLMRDIRRGFETKDAEAHVQEERLELHEKDGSKKFYMQHKVQVQSSLYITGYNDWVLRSYCKNMQPIDLIIKPDLEFHKSLEKLLYEFIGKLHAKLKHGRRKGWIKNV